MNRYGFAAIYGVAGAAIGSLIGWAIDHRGSGKLVGTGIGAVGGAVYGIASPPDMATDAFSYKGWTSSILHKSGTYSVTLRYNLGGQTLIASPDGPTRADMIAAAQTAVDGLIAAGAKPITLAEYDATLPKTAGSVPRIGAGASGLLAAAGLSGNETITLQECYRAGQCPGGVRAWMARHGFAGRTEVSASEIARAAARSGRQLPEVLRVLQATR